MTHKLIAAALALEHALAQENAALEAHDIPAATAQFATKRDAAEAFATVHATLAADPDTSFDHRAAAEAGMRLGALAARNRRLLTRAISVQEQVIATIARAAPREVAQAPRYGANGHLVATPQTPPMAVLARV